LAFGVLGGGFGFFFFFLGWKFGSWVVGLGIWILDSRFRV